MIAGVKASPPASNTPFVVAVVLAGGGADDALAARLGASSKALVPLKGRPMGGYVLDAVAGAERVAQTVWVGETTAGMDGAVDVQVGGGSTLAESLAIGLGAAEALAGPDARLLVVTADVPWLRPSSVDRFVVEALGHATADLVYPVVDRAVSEAVFPGHRRTWVRLRHGEVTGGNLVLATPTGLRAALPWMTYAYRHRKQPWRLAWRVGLPTLAALLLGRARDVDLARRASRLIGVPTAVLRSDDPSLAMDVDRPDDLPLTLDLDSDPPVGGLPSGHASRHG